MRNPIPAACSGVAVAALLYGLLALIEPENSAAIDPWMRAWIAAGLAVEFRESGPAERGRGLFGDAARELSRRERRDTTVHRYRVNLITLEVVELPSDDFLEEIPEGTHLPLAPPEGWKKVHVCRRGRFVALMARTHRLALTKWPTRKETVKQAFEAFETVVDRQERRR